MNPARALYQNLICPQGHDELQYKPEKNELWNLRLKIAYPIRNGIPIMVAEATRPLTDEELSHE